jgi:hypothetical protein
MLLRTKYCYWCESWTDTTLELFFASTLKLSTSQNILYFFQTTSGRRKRRDPGTRRQLASGAERRGLRGQYLQEERSLEGRKRRRRVHRSLRWRRNPVAVVVSAPAGGPSPTFTTPSSTPTPRNRVHRSWLNLAGHELVFSQLDLSLFKLFEVD